MMPQTRMCSPFYPSAFRLLLAPSEQGSAGAAEANAVFFGVSFRVGPGRNRQRQAGAVRQGIAADADRGGGKLQFLQRGAAAEGAVTDPLDPARDVERLQAVAVPERARAEEVDAFRKDELREAARKTAAEKRGQRVNAAADAF